MLKSLRTILLNCKMKVFLPAGLGPEKNDSRSEIIARQDWLQEFKDSNLDLGFEIRGIFQNFNPAILNGLPYGIHAPNNILTQLRIAELADNQKFVNDFWQQIGQWTQLDPAPEYILFHGAELGEIPPINDQRFEYPVKPEEMLKLATWHEALFNQMKEKGVNRPVLENINLLKYYDYLPITYVIARFGVYQDLVKFKAKTGCEVAIDFEHLLTTVQTLNRESVELEAIEKPLFAKVNSSLHFLEHFGFLAKQGQIPQAHPDFPITWEGVVSKIRPMICHLTGISAGHVIELDPGSSDTFYHHDIRQRFGEKIWQLARNWRRGDHAPLKRNDRFFQKMLRQVLSVAENPEELTLVLETQRSKELFPDTHYWSQPDALQFSLHELKFILQEIKTYS